MKVRRKPVGKPKLAVPTERKNTLARRYVYAMIDESIRQAFYVGISEDPYERFIQHLRCTDTNVAKNAYIQQLKARRLVPIMHLVHVSKEYLDWHLKIEAYYVDLYRRNHHPLTNQHLQIGYTLDEYDLSMIETGTLPDYGWQISSQCGTIRPHYDSSTRK